MAYLTPRTQISQQFEQLAVFHNNPLAACIVGPQYNLYRYTESSEKVSTQIGAYDKDNDTAYAYPNRAAGTIVDTAFTKVHFENIVARYFSDLIGSGATIVNPSTTYKNRIYSSGLVFKTNSAAARSAGFYNRDVQIGDVATVSDGTTTVTTKVTGLIADVVSSTIDAYTVNGASNKTNASVDFNDVPTLTAGSATGTTIVNDSTAYVGHIEKGIVSDVYTVTVTSAGNLSTARFSIASANGAFETKTNVALETVLGDANILVIDNDGGNDIRFDFTGSTTINLGATWTVPVTAAVTQRNASSSGTYTGNSDITYYITVVRGGAFFNGSNASTCARVKITSNGVDSSGPVNVQEDVPFVVGTRGVLATFADAVSNGGLILGDVYTLNATAAAVGPIRTLELADELPTDLLAGNASDLTLHLALVKNSLEIPEIRSLEDDTVNWVSASNEITINSGAVINDTLIADVNGDLIDLPVQSATVFVTHRDLVRTNATTYGSISSLGSIESVLGKVSTDNPLAQGVYHALLNSFNTSVYYIAVETNDLAGYNAALDRIKFTDKIYGIVPLTTEKAVQDAVTAHVNAMSTPVAAKWRQAWFSLPLVESTLILDQKEDTTDWTATVADDPLTAGTQYSLVTIAGAQLLTNEVRPGDVLLINYRLAPNGQVLNDEYVISEVRTESTLVLETGLPSAVVLPIKVEIRRDYTKQEQAQDLADRISALSNRRVLPIFPDKAALGSTVYEGFYVAAAAAGLASGSVPHQPLTNIELLGFDNVSRSLTYFTEDQLNLLAENGAFIVTQETLGAAPYIRHQLTSDVSNLNFAEQSVTRNVDSISYGLQAACSPYIGKYNANPETLALIRFAIERELKFRQTNTFTTQAGNQLIDWRLEKLTINETFKDRIDASIRLTVPYPLNYINITLVI